MVPYGTLQCGLCSCCNAIVCIASYMQISNYLNQIIDSMFSTCSRSLYWDKSKLRILLPRDAWPVAYLDFLIPFLLIRFRRSILRSARLSMLRAFYLLPCPALPCLALPCPVLLFSSFHFYLLSSSPLCMPLLSASSIERLHQFSVKNEPEEYNKTQQNPNTPPLADILHWKSFDDLCVRARGCFDFVQEKVNSEGLVGILE